MDDLRHDHDDLASPPESCAEEIGEINRRRSADVGARTSVGEETGW